MGGGSSSAAAAVASPAASKANARCSLFLPHPVINKASGTEKILEWTFLDHSGTHVVRLEHDVFSGRRLIAVDGATVFSKAHTLLDTGSTHAFRAASHQCVASIVEMGNSFGYALTVNEQSWARFRAEFWHYAALWRLPRNGGLVVADSWSPDAAALVNSLAALSRVSRPPPAFAAASSASPSPSASAHATPSSPSSVPGFHTVIVLSHPALTVLVNGRPAELSSSFAAEGHEGEEGTKHVFEVGVDDDDDEGDEGEEGGNSASSAARPSASAAAAASAASSAPPSRTVSCELTVWLDSNEPPLPSGHVASHVPREKKHGRYRYALRMGGQIVAQAPSPLAGVHNSLQSSANSSSGGNSRAAGASSTHRTTSSAGGGFGELMARESPRFAAAAAPSSQRHSGAARGSFNGLQLSYPLHASPSPAAFVPSSVSSPGRPRAASSLLPPDDGFSILEGYANPDDASDLVTAMARVK